MEKTITISGQAVKLKATAAVPRLYRIKFRRDIIQDITALKKVVKKKKTDGGDLPPEALEMFENVAYIMARHADPEGVPNTPEEWLDKFDTFSIYQVLPEIRELWQLNMETRSTPKKK